MGGDKLEATVNEGEMLKGYFMSAEFITEHFHIVIFFFGITLFFLGCILCFVASMSSDEFPPVKAPCGWVAGVLGCP